MESFKQAGKNLFWSFTLDALLMVISGIIIFLYPDILGLVVGLSFIILGIKGLLFAFKVRNTLK